MVVSNLTQCRNQERARAGPRPDAERTVFGWLKFEQRARRKTVKLDRTHLEARTRRFLKAYLAADETRKPPFYHAVEDASAKCHPPNTDYQLEDAEMAEATSRVAM